MSFTNHVELLSKYLTSIPELPWLAGVPKTVLAPPRDQYFPKNEQGASPQSRSHSVDKSSKWSHLLHE